MASTTILDWDERVKSVMDKTMGERIDRAVWDNLPTSKSLEKVSPFGNVWKTTIIIEPKYGVKEAITCRRRPFSQN